MRPCALGADGPFITISGRLHDGAVPDASHRPPTFEDLPVPDPERLRRVQLVRKAVLLAAIIAALVVAALTRSLHGAEDFHETWEAVGLALIVVCIVGRAWCSLYIGGRKKAEIVDRGPYSVSRNPLYLFSFMGAFGLGAQTGSFTLAAAFLVLTVAVFYVTVRREEDWLAASLRRILSGLQGPNAAFPAGLPALVGCRDPDHPALLLPHHLA